jgi:uncharacterized protein (DUF1330 family)
MAAYVVVDVSRTDLDRATRYSEMVGSTLERHGGRFLARGAPIDTLEGDWQPERVVVIEFPSADAARAWYESEEYLAARAVRAGAGRWSMIVVDGV